MSVQALVLDSEGLSKAVRRTPDIQEWLQAAWEDDIPVVTSAATLVEAVHPRIDRASLRWTLSKVTVESVTPEIATMASQLLMDAGLHGHKYAIDAMLAATALRQPGMVVVLTSDVDDLATLCEKQPRIRVQGI